MTRHKILFAVLSVCASLFSSQPAEAAIKLRLIYGDDWSRAGRTVKSTLSSGEFRSASKGRYVVEFVNAKDVKNFNDRAMTRKLPAIQVVSERGQCFCVIDNVPAEATVAQILRKVGQVNAIREEAEAAGFQTAEDCGAFLCKMEKYVGGPWRIISAGYYPEIYQKLKSLDPKDETGWIRHFELGVKVECTDQFGKSYEDGGWKADGLGIVIKANNFRERGQFSEGEAYLQNEQKVLPVRHLTLDQKQSLLMARFALYREDQSKRREMIALLKRIADAGEETFWGTAAVGWLNWLGEPPLSAYWGWRKGDFKGPKLAQPVKFGIGHSFSKAGHYTIQFIRDDGSSDAPRIESVQLMAGKEQVALVGKPQVEGRTTTFEVDIRREHRGRITAMIVRGSAGPSGDSSGKIDIHRRVLRARKEAANGSVPALGGPKDAAAPAGHIARAVGKETVAAIAKKEGGAAFLKTFFTDVDWLEQFAGSGMWSIRPWKGLKEEPEIAAKALEALDLLVWNDKDDFIKTKIGRNIATALALNHGCDWTPEKLVLVMECYREWAREGTLHDDAWEHDVRQWREVLGFGQNAELPVENLRWIHDFANMPAGAYYGLCWSCDYRLWNCFGASVHGSDYYRPWAHRWNTQELRYRVGGVCGALSKFGAHGAASHGIRSFTAGQPGHCAYVLWDYSVDRWGIAYAVTAHTSPHNTLGGGGFAALEEQNRYYRNPKRMAAERLRWKGDFAGAMKLCPGNYHAGVDWVVALEKKNASLEEWKAFGDAVCATFNGFPSQGWALYNAYLGHIKGRDARLAAAKQALGAIRESTEPTFENPYWDEIALGPLDKHFPNDEPALWALFAASLDGQAKTPTFYRQTIGWGAGRLMKDGDSAKRFLTVVGKSALKTGEKLDYRSMIRKASESEDIAMWRQVYTLMDKLNPGLAPKATGKGWPKEQYGGTLLSSDGLLKISETSNWDNPEMYRHALTSSDYAGDNAFHTGKGNAPWGMVVLPGSSDIMGVTVVNSGGGQNRSRQVPLRIWLSDDGSEWKQVFASDSVQDEWKCALPSPIKAKYIKVGRENDPTSGEHLFHLHKILVYGKKLY
ncbi:MAG: hypothetical protein ACI4R9_08920 [Kiritimatiellia bacterium]